MAETEKPKDLTVEELKDELGEKGLSTDGKKDELVERLEETLKDQPGVRGIRGDEPQYVRFGE